MDANKHEWLLFIGVNSRPFVVDFPDLDAAFPRCVLRVNCSFVIWDLFRRLPDHALCLGD
jgi:hypothetical protein